MKCPRCGYVFYTNPLATKTLLRTLEVNLKQGPAPRSAYRDFMPQTGIVLTRLVANNLLVCFRDDDKQKRFFILTPSGLYKLIERGLVPPEKEQEYKQILKRLIEEWVPTRTS